MNIIIQKLKRIYWYISLINKTIFDHGLIKVTKNKGQWEKRYPPLKSLNKTAKLFNQINGKVIVEIGSGIHGNYSQYTGDSCLTWAKKTNAKVIKCVDLDPKMVEAVAEATKEFDALEAVLDDGLDFLSKTELKIDLLLLDFWTEETDNSFGSRRAEKYLEAYKNGKDKMSPKSLILIDDTDHAPPWKDTYIVPEARKDGFKVIYIGRQTLLARGIENPNI